MTSNVCLFLTILANKCTVRSMVIFLYIFFFAVHSIMRFHYFPEKSQTSYKFSYQGCLEAQGRSHRSYYSRMKRYLYDFWNAVDLLSYILLIAALFVRHFYIDETFTIARRMFALSLLVMYLRFLEAFLIHRKLGPTLIMIQEMVCSFDFHIHITIFIRFKHQSIAMEENRDFIAICVSSVDCLLYKFS